MNEMSSTSFHSINSIVNITINIHNDVTMDGSFAWRLARSNIISWTSSICSLAWRLTRVLIHLPRLTAHSLPPPPSLSIFPITSTTTMDHDSSFASRLTRNRNRHTVHLLPRLTAHSTCFSFVSFCCIILPLSRFARFIIIPLGSFPPPHLP